LEGGIPREQPVRRGLNPRRRARDSCKGYDPEVDALRSGRQVRPGGDRVRLTASGFSGRGNVVATLREEKAPKGGIPRALSG
jgi:hypothetical protein